MSSTRKIQSFMVIVTVCALFAGITSAAQGDAVYSYDFDSITANNGDSINGKDSWRLRGGASAVIYNDWVNELSSDNAVCFNLTDSFISRTNDGNWSYAIPDDSVFTVEWTALIGSTSYKTALALEANGGSSTAFRMWAGGSDGWRFRDANGANTYSTDTVNYASSDGEVWRICLTVDLAANAGDGAASLSVGKITNGAYTLTAISDMQDLNMHLTDKGIEGSDLDGFFLRGSGGGAIDDILITVSAVPEPSMIVMLLGGLGFLVARRCRKAG